MGLGQQTKRSLCARCGEEPSVASGWVRLGGGVVALDPCGRDMAQGQREKLLSRVALKLVSRWVI